MHAAHIHIVPMVSHNSTDGGNVATQQYVKRGREEEEDFLLVILDVDNGKSNFKGFM